MKRLLLSAAIVATAAPAWAQEETTFETAIYNTNCNPYLPSSELRQCRLDILREDLVISIGQAIGEADISDLTVPTTILTQREIQNRNQGVIADLLRTVPSLAVSQNGGAGSLTQIRMRGSEANHIVVIIDGVEAANPADGAFDFGGLRTEDIVKIEVLRGEQSALYGSDAVGGVINIITRAGSTTESWRASVEGGSRDTLEGQVSAVIPLGDAALTVNGNIFTTDGFDISGQGAETDSAKSRAINLGLNNIEVGPITFSGKFGSSIRETSFDSDSDFDGRLNNTNDETEVKTDTARIDARFTLAGFDHKLTAHMVETDTDTVGGFASRSIGSRHVANWAAKRDFNNNHSFTALAEAEHEQYQLLSAFNDSSIQPEFWNFAIAGDYRFTKDSVTLTASARHDMNDQFNDSTTWRLGAGYAFVWDGRLRASLGTAVKNPTLTELFGFFPALRFTGNPDLKSETSQGISIGYEQKIGELNIGVDVFRSKLENEITGSNNSVLNLDRDSKREGIELSASWSSDTVSLQGSASFLNSEQDDVEEIRRPKVISSATASWQPVEDINVTISADYNGKQLDENFGDCVFVPAFSCAKIELDSFVLVGANLRYNLLDQVALTLRGSNVLNENYQEVLGYASPGRAIYGGLEIDF